DHSDDQRKLSSRLVHLHRDESLGLGLSIKGGSDHSLPILISRIVSQSPADLCKQLFIGDEIIAVNGVDFDSTTTHDEALKLLRQSDDEISMKVRHHRVANIYRKQWRKNDNQFIDLQDDNPLIKKTSTLDLNDPKELIQNESNGANSWKECVRMELFLSNLSQYVSFSDKLRDAGFEVRAINGQTALVQCDNQEMCREWCQTITNAINNLTLNHMKLLNKSLPKSEHILYMGWVSECQTIGYQPKQSYKWSQEYLIIKGGALYIHKCPPNSLIQNDSQLNIQLINKSLYHYNCYQSVFRCLKPNEQLDDKRNVCIIQSAEESSPKYLSTETSDDLTNLKNAWHRANYHSVTQLGSKTFPVVCDGMSGSLTLDWRMGFALYDPLVKEYKWNYKFHQLKHSSDDGNHELSLTFVTNPNDSRITETQLLECNSLQNLLYCMHAFLSAKVASVDPRFLQSS
ncbi:unnamed protein product, partial [Oppiella nova]